METKVWLWSSDQGTGDGNKAIQEAAVLLREGRLVAFPTETVYGLGANARNTEAVEGIFRAKGRPSDNPLIVHISELGQLDALVERTCAVERRLMDAFWPGPLTLVLPARPGAVSPRVTAGLDTVAVRMPAHPAALALIGASGCPVAAPSANRSGRPSPTRAEHVRADLDGAIAGIVDAGATGVGLESTVVRVVGDVVYVLRPGGIGSEELRRHAAQVVDAAGEGAHAREDGAAAADPAEAAEAPSGAPAEPKAFREAAHEAGIAAVSGADRPRSPGMKYAHYAPRGRMTLVGGANPERVAAWIRGRLAEARAAGERTGVLTYAEHAADYAGKADCLVPCGRLGDPATIAHRLYDALRQFDDRGIEAIWAEACPEEGIGAAVMNRLRKASGGSEIRLD